MPSLAQTIEELGRAFDQFKAANDQRLTQIEQNGHADPLLEQKVNRANDDVTRVNDQLQKQRMALEKRIDDIEAAANRNAFGGGGAVSAPEAKARAEHRQAFDTWFRKGVDSGLRDLEVNAKLTTQIDEDGGFIVPEEVDTEIERVLGETTVMRSLATVRTVGSTTYKKFVNVGGSTSGWVGEEEARPETATPKLKGLEYPTKELYAEPATTQTLLEDGFFDVEAWLADELAIEFAEQEGSAFINGDGVAKPRGILGYPTVANSSYVWGKMGFIKSGANGAFAASNPSDTLIDLIHALKRGYRQNGRWLMNDLTLAEIRKFKDANGNYIWRPGLRDGEESILLGYPADVDDFMPDMASGSHSIAFADFRRTYVITDRRGSRVLRDALTDKPNVKFYTTKRVGGGVQNFESIKLMRFSA